MIVNFFFLVNYNMLLTPQLELFSPKSHLKKVPLLADKIIINYLSLYIDVVTNYNPLILE